MNFVIILIYSLRFTYNVNKVFCTKKKQIVKCYYSLKQLHFLKYLQFYILVSHDPSEIILICIFIIFY